MSKGKKLTKRQIYKTKGGTKYSVPALWQLANGIAKQQVMLAELVHLLKKKIWRTKEGKKISPLTVLKQKEGYHKQLIDSANMKYPIIMGPDEQVMDGYHRIAKAYILEQETISAKQFSTYKEMQDAVIEDNGSEN